MKLGDAEKFYRFLSIFTLLLTILLIIRRAIIVEGSPIEFLFGMGWPIIGSIITIGFINRDGYTLSVQECLFYVFILYCSIYFFIHIFITPQISPEILAIDIGISLVGAGGIISYIFF